jgi:hypothetical protein
MPLTQRTAGIHDRQNPALYRPGYVTAFYPLRVSFVGSETTVIPQRLRQNVGPPLVGVPGTTERQHSLATSPHSRPALFFFPARCQAAPFYDKPCAPNPKFRRDDVLMFFL